MSIVVMNYLILLSELNLPEEIMARAMTASRFSREECLELWYSFVSSEETLQSLPSLLRRALGFIARALHASRRERNAR